MVNRFDGGIYGDENRDGLDDDVDRVHGNQNDSSSYARIYDPRSEQEFSNQPEPQNILQARDDFLESEARRDQARRAIRAGQQDVHFFPNVGKFIIPAENTWAAHAELVLDNKQLLHFNPDRYFFDEIIADKLNIPALTDKGHPDFEKYKGLRTNLEVLRNDIIGMYLDDGAFDKGDEIYLPMIQGIAETLATALSNDVWWKRPFTDHFSLDVANVEAVGAAEMYKYLLEKQQQPSYFANFWAGLRELIGLPNNNWGLLPLERSSFSPEALSAPPPQVEKAIEVPSKTVTKEVAEHRAMESLSLISSANSMKKPVATLSEQDKVHSVEDGRTILRWLRNMQGVDMDVQDFLSAGSPQEQVAKAEALGNLVKIYMVQMQQHPELHDVQEVKDGGDAAGGAAMMIAEHAMSLLPEKSAPYAMLASAVDRMPEVHFERSHQSVERLLGHIERGLAKISGRTISERSPMDRLLEVRTHMEKTARELRSVDTMEETKREESVELGREILRKLRGLTFSDKSMEEMVESGRPEDKAILVEKLDELVEIYRNIIVDAIKADPGLVDDPRIKDANDAVGGMTHGISLMASKEIPNSHAQAQQISADITQTPEEWKRLHDRAVERLLDTMEGGLEAAVQAIETQEEEGERDAELAQEAIEASLLQAEMGRRKRRKKKAMKSGMSGKKAAKINREIIADDRAAGQGRFSEEAEMQEQEMKNKKQAYMGLGSHDIAAIQALANTLKRAGHDAKNMPMADINGDGIVTADERSAAERAIEQIKSARKNNRNSVV